MKAETIKKLPNILSLARIISVPVVLAILMLPVQSAIRVWIAALLFVISAATDSLDGHLARKYDAVTNFGKFIDPVADKLLVVSVMIWVAVDAAAGWVTIVAVLTTAREFIISAFRLVAVTEGGRVIAAGWLGKIKTVTQYIALTAYILKACFLPVFSNVIFVVFLIISAVMTVWSCADYIARNIGVLKGGVQ
jgi:CDP-diacylglycerol--glycerol-3-phosphate 3-phosphatidyltransferase